MDLAAELAPSGTLVASINLGNPVLAQGDPPNPRGISVELAREFAARVGVPVEFACFTAAKDSFAALVDGRAGVAFLATDPRRAELVRFSEPYALIEGVYVVPDDSPLRAAGDVDRRGVRIGVKEGSAYDLFLTRSLRAAQLVRGSDGITVYAEQGLAAGAGIRQPLTQFVAENPGHRLIDEAFMQIRQAVAVSKDLSAETVDFVQRTVEDLKACGFVADSLARSGQGGVQVAPAAS